MTRTHSTSARGTRRCIRLAVFAAVPLLAACGAKRENAAVSLRDTIAEQPRRPVELRLNGVPWAPYAGPKRGGESGADQSLQAIAHAALAEQTSDARTRALATLLLGRHDEAIGTLTELAAKSKDAALWTDLSAALDVHATADDDPHVTARALAAADRALELAPASPEALFNRAVALEKLGLERHAVAAWDRYLAQDAQSKWAEEARSRKARLHQPTQAELWNSAKPQLEAAALRGDDAAVMEVVRSFPQDARMYCEVEYLPNWGSAIVAADAEGARNALQIAAAIGDALARINGETLMQRCVAAARRDEGQRLARAHVVYRDGRMLVAKRIPAEAVPLLARAEEAFRAGGSPMELLSMTYRASALFDAHRGAEARALLDALAPRLRESDYAVRAYAAWNRGNMAGRRGALYEALAATNEAHALFERLGERENALRQLTNRADLYAVLQRPSDAWRTWREVFTAASRSGRADAIEAALHASGLEELREGRNDTGWSLLSLLLTGAPHSPVRRAEAELFRALAAIREQRPAKLDATVADKVPDEALRQDVADQIRFVEALAVRERDPAAAARMLSESIAYREREHSITRAATYLERGRALRQLGRTADAASDFDRALELFEEDAANIESADLRDSYFATADDACAALIGAELDRNAEVAAFVAAERCRARTLAEIIGSPRSVARPLEPREVSAALPDRHALLHYTSLPDRVVAFVITRGGFAMRSFPVRRATLADAAARLRDAAADESDARVDAVVRELHAMLVAPVAPLFGGASEVTVVPDETLAAIPFAALRDAGGAYVVTQHAIAIAPSARTFLTGAPAGAMPAQPRVTFIADPAFDRKEAGDLPRLPAARAEAAAAARLYTNATVVSDTAASPTRVLRELASSDIAHFATHAIVSSRDARSSVLVLADDLLYLPVIREQRLAKRPVIVLAGCQTAVNGGGRGSLRSLAFAFLAAGSRGVIGSTWDVRDHPTNTFSTELHRRLRTGRPPIAVLRETQLHMLRSTDPSLRSPAAWGGFQMYGFNSR